jgi:tetratricopeptide (TPR) repeat protein
MAEGKTLQEAFMANDHGKVVAEIDRILGKHPALARQLNPIKFMSLLKSDEAGAYALGKSMVAGEFKSDPQVMNQVAWTILDTADLKKPDFALALDAAKAAAEATKHEDGMILDTLALATFKSGDTAKAIEIQTKAIDLAKKTGDKDTVAEMEGRLAEFKKGGK